MATIVVNTSANPAFVTFPDAVDAATDLGWFNVREYGAVGDGATNDSAAFTSTYNAALAGGGGTVYFPPGQYLMSSATSANQTAGIVGSVILQGCGDNSEIIVNPGAITTWLTSGNLANFTVRDMMIRSPTPQGASAHCSFAFNLGTVYNAVFERVNFYGLLCTFGLITGNPTGLDMRDCNFVGASADAAGGQGLIFMSASRGGNFERCRFIDVGGFRGATYTIGGHAPWIYLEEPTVNYTSIGQTTVRIIQCGFDEGAQAVKCLPTTAAKWGRVAIEDCNFLTETTYGNQLSLKQIEKLEIRRCGLQAQVAATWIDLLTVVSAEIEKCSIAHTDGPWTITVAADANCTALRVREMPGFTISPNAAVVYSQDDEGWLANAVGGTLASAATIAVTHQIHKVSGTAEIATITPPYTAFTGVVILIPTGIFTTATSGNIGLASTAVVGKALIMTMHSDGKWYPSY